MSVELLQGTTENETLGIFAVSTGCGFQHIIITWFAFNLIERILSIASRSAGKGGSTFFIMLTVLENRLLPSPAKAGD
jgi:hypothetical protein